MQFSFSSIYASYSVYCYCTILLDVIFFLQKSSWHCAIQNKLIFFCFHLCHKFNKFLQNLLQFSLKFHSRAKKNKINKGPPSNGQFAFDSVYFTFHQRLLFFLSSCSISFCDHQGSAHRKNHQQT
jgi:hypothetical protein